MVETKRARLRRTPWICGCGLVLATAAVLWLYLRSSHAQDLADPLRARRKGEPLPVRAALVEQKQLEQVIGATALTVPSEIAPIRLGPSRELSTNGPLSNLTVRAVHVREGDLVHRDQVVLEVDTNMLEESLKHKQTTLAAAEAALAYVRENISYTQKLRELALEMAKAELQYRTADLDRRQTEYDATNKLYQGSPSGSAWPAVSLFAFVNAFSQYIQAKYELAVARDRLERAKRAIPVGLLKDKQDLALACSWSPCSSSGRTLRSARRSAVMSTRSAGMPRLPGARGSMSPSFASPCS